MLEGFPVTELGAYIFSDHIDSTELKMMQEKENFCTENGRATRPEDDMPQAAGNRVEEIRLPRQLRKIGRYAFYNCFHLKKLTFYGKMQDLGAGALTGCHRMEQIAVETDEKGDVRTVMHFHPALAPFKAAVLPLSKKLSEKATEIYSELSKDFMIDFDDAGSIGKRYRRQDEIGTPVCITYDFDSVEDKCVTVRDRDTMEQKRIPIAELKAYIAEAVKF